MTDFFKNNPIALRHCFLYEFLRQIPFEESFIALHNTIGSDVIKKEEFQVWFDKFNQGIFDINEDKKPITDMRNLLRSDKYALRVCILYEALKLKLAEPLFKTLYPNGNSAVNEIRANRSFAMYNVFCRVIGDDVMEYREFDFWFYRFLNGEFDLNYERDKNEKSHELMDMPIDAMKEVVKYLDFVDRINLKKTSRSFHTFVEDQKLFQNTLELNVSNNTTMISFGEDGIKFETRERRDPGVEHWKQAFLDLKNILDNPKLYLHILKIGLDADKYNYRYSKLLENAINDLEDAWKFTHYLNVKNVLLVERSWELLVKIVPMLKPGYLKTIEILSTNPNGDSMKKVFEMEQWKQAKCFFMYGNCFVWPLHHLYHFVDFDVRLKKMSVEDIREMREILFKSPNFETCLIRVLNDTGANAIEQEFGDYILQEQSISKYVKFYHYPIPHSKEYFEIKVAGFDFEITRKKR